MDWQKYGLTGKKMKEQKHAANCQQHIQLKKSSLIDSIAEEGQVDRSARSSMQVSYPIVDFHKVTNYKLQVAKHTPKNVCKKK